MIIVTVAVSICHGLGTVLALNVLSLFQDLFICFRERDREQEQLGRGRGRDPMLSLEPDSGLDAMTHKIVTCAKTKNRTLNQLSHAGVPLTYFLLHLLQTLRSKSKYLHFIGE